MASSDRLIELFSEAKALPAGDRTCLVDEACRDDPDLKEQLLVLLRAHDKAGDFLQPAPLLPSDSPANEQPGDRIGRYKLLEPIGEGGCGVVYMAEQEEPVRRRVALKVIKLGMDTKSVIARFDAERQALAMMDHPNIAKVLDAGATDAGRPYFVMELVRGVRITDYCDQNNLTTEERLKLFIQVCQAVQHAHQKGIIHRDLKPSNILVTLHDGVPVPKVIDFGVAKATQERLTDLTVYTQVQQLIGTPLYMSPEQAEMNGLDVDTRTDIYALGVLLYELLTGRTPFDAETLHRSGYDEMRRFLREVEPPKPSTALHTMAEGNLKNVAHHRASEPPKLIHAIRGDLDWIVMKTLEKDRARRYETASGLAADIRRHLENEPVMARPPSSAYRFRKLVRRNRLVFAAGSAVLGALALGVIVSTLQAVRARRAEQQQSLLRSRAETEAAKARAISDFLQRALDSANPEMLKGAEYTVRQLLDDSSASLANSLEAQPEAEAALRITIGRAYHRLGQGREALVHLERALTLRRRVFGEQSELVAESLVELAFAFQTQAQQAKGVACAQDALKIYRGKDVIGQPRINALWALEVNLSGLNRAEEVEAVAEEASLIASRSPEIEFPEMASIIQGLAGRKSDQQKYEEAQALGRRALEMQRRLRGADHPETAWAQVHLGIALRRGGKTAEAEATLREAHSLFLKIYPRGHYGIDMVRGELTKIAKATGNLAALEQLAEQRINDATKRIERSESNAEAWMERALAQADAKRWDAALADRIKALEIRQKALGPEHADTLWAMNAVSDSYVDAGRPYDALKLREELLALRRKVLGPENRDTLWAMNTLSNSYADTGRQDDALKLREEMLALRRKALGPEDRDTFLAMDAVSNSYVDAGRLDDALKLHEEMLAGRRKVSGPEHPDTLWAIKRLAASYADAGADHHDAVVKLREEVLALLSKANGPKHPDLFEAALTLQRKVLGLENPETLRAMTDLANSLHDAGRREEALKLREEALALHGKVFGPDRPETHAAMNNLANSYLDAGRVAEAFSLLADASIREPENTYLATKLCSLQVWFAKKADHAATRQRLLEWAANTSDHEDAERVARIACLRPIDDAPTREATLALARRAVELGAGNTRFLPYAHMVLGMAEYRSGHYPAADEALTTAAKTSSAGGGHWVEGTACFYRAMSLFKQGRQAEARELFTAAEPKMNPQPADEKNPLADGKSTADHLILWLAGREARSLLNAPPASQP